MRTIFIVCNTDDEPVMAFESQAEAEKVAIVDGLSSVTYTAMLFEGGEHDDLPVA